MRQKIALIIYKGGICEDCGTKDIFAMDFHHKNPEKKSFNISKGAKSWKLMKEEVDKCDLLCSNCHRKRHDYWNGLLETSLEYEGRNLEMRFLLEKAKGNCYAQVR